MEKKLQIFVSSTFTDMKDERQAAVEAILRSGNIPAGMELFAAGDKSQLETITRWIDDSDIYLLLLGGRYGTIESNTGKSYTEIEYDYAKSNNKPLFAIVINETYLDNKVKQFGKNVIETENKDLYDEFRKKVLRNVSRFFSSTDDIKLSIFETILNFKEEYEFTGWIPGDKKLKYDELLEENIELRKTIEKLSQEKRDHKTEKKSKNDNIDTQDFDIIFNDFNSKGFKYNINGIEKTVSINKFILEYHTLMITGIENRYGIGKLEQVLFFGVMPQMILYELTEMTSIPRVSYRRFFLTQKGKQYAIYVTSNKDKIIDIIDTKKTGEKKLDKDEKLD